MTEMNARLRGFLGEVRRWFWEHPYAGVDHPNDLLIAVEAVRREHPELDTLDLLRDINEAGFGEFLDLDIADRDVLAIIEEPSLEASLTALHAIAVREIVRAEDALTEAEDKRRLELERQAEERRYLGRG